MHLIGIAAVGFLLIAVIGARAVGAILLISIALLAWIASRSPMMQAEEPRPRPHPTAETCAMPDVPGVSALENSIYKEGCPGVKPWR